MAKVYVGLEGFVMKRCYVIKELSVLFDDDRRDHYRFAAPKDLSLTPDEARTVRYASRHLNGLSIYDSGIDYDQLRPILDSLSGNVSGKPS